MDQRKIITAGFRLMEIALGGLFIYAGILKMENPTQFALEIRNYHLLSPFLAALAAVYLPCLEVIVGFLILIKKWISPSLTILGILIFIYMIAIASAWWRGLDISCGCFSHSIQPANYFKLLTRDFLILTIIGSLLWINRSKDTVF